MRKGEREITDSEQKLEALLRCESMTVAFGGEGAPYMIPLNFGAELVEGQLYLYFHCALEGEKLNRLRKDARVSFCAYRLLRVFQKRNSPCGYTTDYESVCGEGRAELVQDAARRLHGLKVLLAHYTDQPFEDGAFEPHALSLTNVVQIRIERWTGKRLIRQ